MRKKSIFYYVYFLMLIGIMLLGLESCTSMLPDESGIVTIDVEIEPIALGLKLERPADNYYIYMDDVYKGMTTTSGVLTIEEVPLGIHTFEASNYLMAGISFDRNITIDLQEKITEKLNGFTCDGSIIFEVKLGVNYVTIPVSCVLITEM